jgi:hypothetical protein
MIDDPGILRTRLDRLACLAHRALRNPLEDRADMERTVHLVCRTLQTVASACQQVRTEEHQKYAIEVESLRQWILDEAQAIGLRIDDRKFLGTNDLALSGEPGRQYASHADETEGMGAIVPSQGS